MHKTKRNKLKIGWFLLGNENVGSTRLHGINVHKYLRSQGIESVIIQSSRVMNHHLTISLLKQTVLLISGFDIFIFQKVFDRGAVRFAKIAKKAGIRTIFLQSDYMEAEIAETVDQVIVVSEYLKELYDRKYGINSIVIEDAIEVDENLEKGHEKKQKLELVWVGHRDNWSSLDIIYKVFERFDDSLFSLRTISNHPDASTQWNLETVFNDILKSDIAIIPAHNNDWSKSKSNNRLTMFMALGMPVIASPLPIYKGLIVSGQDGFIADTIDEWVDSLKKLRNLRLREEMGRKARDKVIKKYRIRNIGKEWISYLSSITQLRNRRLCQKSA